MKKNVKIGTMQAEHDRLIDMATRGLISDEDFERKSKQIKNVKNKGCKNNPCDPYFIYYISSLLLKLYTVIIRECILWYLLYICQISSIPISICRQNTNKNGINIP